MPADLSDKLVEVGGLDVESLLGAGLGAASLGAANAVGLGGQAQSADPVAAPPNQNSDADPLAGLGSASFSAQDFETPTLDGNDPPPAPADGFDDAATHTSPAAEDGSNIWRTVLMAIIAVLVVWLIINLIR